MTGILKGRITMTDKTQLSLSIEESYRAATPQSRAAYERGKASMPGGVAKGAYFYQPYPLTMACGDGCYLFDVDGRRYVDFAGHHTAQILGHNHPAVMAAIHRQLEQGI